MLGRKEIGETIASAAEKAGTLVTAALAISCCALLVALAALAVALKVRAA